MVVDGGGNTVKDARIEIMDWEVMPQNMRLNRQKPVVTSEKGEFTAGRLAKGKTNIRITHPDYKGVFLAGVSTDSIDVTGVLQPKGNTGVTVKVKDSAGRPFAGAALSLFGINAYGYVGIEDGRTPEVIKLEGITDHTGTCAITVPGQKKEERIMWSLLCDAPGYYPFFCGLYEDTDTILEISLKRQEESDPMSGFVTDLNGKPVKNVKVKAGYISASSYSRGVRGGSWYPEEMITAFTGSDGRFVFQKISMEHSATLEASGEGYASRRFFSGSAREPGSGITVQLLPPCEISGKIIYEETRKPAGGLLVSASSMTGGDSAACRTDGEGFYRLKTLPAGTYHLRAGFVPLHSPLPNEEPPEYVLSPAGYSSVTAYEDKPVTGKDFVLKKGILVSGKVIEKSTGKPLADAYLTCYSGEISSGMYSGSARTDSDGRYRMRMLPGKGYIQMYRQGGTSPQTRELTVEEGKIYNNVDIEVE